MRLVAPDLVLKVSQVDGTLTWLDGTPVEVWIQTAAATPAPIIKFNLKAVP